MESNQVNAKQANSMEDALNKRIKERTAELKVLNDNIALANAKKSKQSIELQDRINNAKLLEESCIKKESELNKAIESITEQRKRLNKLSAQASLLENKQSKISHENDKLEKALNDFKRDREEFETYVKNTEKKLEKDRADFEKSKIDNSEIKKQVQILKSKQINIDELAKEHEAIIEKYKVENKKIVSKEILQDSREKQFALDKFQLEQELKNITQQKKELEMLRKKLGV